MSHETEEAPPTDQRHGSQLIATRPEESEGSSMTSITADRIYQFAALTAGLFFLATLL